MFFNIENPNKKKKQNTHNNQKGIIVTNTKQYSKSKKGNVKREKIIKINNPKNIEQQINYNYKSYQHDTNTSGIVNYFFVRIYFESKNDSYLALQNNVWEFLNFIHSKIEKSFVLDPNNIQTFYSSSDNQVRIKIYYR